MKLVLMSAALTVYIFTGLWYEERDLVRNFGDQYLRYCEEAGALFPSLTKHRSGH